MTINIYVFHCGGDRSAKAIYDPLDDNPGQIVYGPNFSSNYPSKRERAVRCRFESKWKSSDGQSEDETFAIEMAEDDDAVNQLGLVRVRPDQISHVIVSHLHFDHAGGLQFFPDATVVVQRKELEFAHWPAVYQRGVYNRRTSTTRCGGWKSTGTTTSSGTGRSWSHRRRVTRRDTRQRWCSWRADACAVRGRRRSDGEDAGTKAAWGPLEPGRDGP